MILAEAFGALAVIVNFIAYRQNDVNRYRLISAVALLSVATHFFMIDALAAGIACILACVRNLIAIKTQHLWVVYVFVALNIGFFLYEWFWLQSGWLIIFAYVSSIIFTIGSVVITDVKVIRRWFAVAEFLGLIYSVLVGSIFGSVFNIVNLTSILVKQYQERLKATED